MKLRNIHSREIFYPWRLVGPGGSTPLYGLYGNVPLDWVWILAALSLSLSMRVCHKHGLTLSKTGMVSTIAVVKYGLYSAKLSFV